MFKTGGVPHNQGWRPARLGDTKDAKCSGVLTDCKVPTDLLWGASKLLVC